MSDDQKNEQNKPSFVPEPKEKKDENKQKKNSEKKPADKNNENKQNPQDFDPYSFFKLSIDEPEDGGKNGGKKPSRFPFFTMLAVTVLALAFINMFLLPKADNTIPFSEFRNLVEDGTIVYVEMGENSFTGYGVPVAENTTSAQSDTSDSVLKSPQLP